jgi:hypothetical protein
MKSHWAYSIHFAIRFAVALPFGGERWNPSHKPNAGGRGPFLVPRDSAWHTLGGRGQLSAFVVEQDETRACAVPMPQIGQVSAGSHL